MLFIKQRLNKPDPALFDHNIIDIHSDLLKSYEYDTKESYETHNRKDYPAEESSQCPIFYFNFQLWYAQ